MEENNNNRRTDGRQETDEKERKKKLAKKRKKREKENKARQLKILTTTLETIERIVNLNKDSDDMNIRCYMLLYNMLLVIEGYTSIILVEYLPEKSKDAALDYINLIKNEIKTLMDWVLNERNIVPAELVNPLPDENSV